MTVTEGLSTDDNTSLTYFPPRTYGVRFGYRNGG
jgi:hypothetical protein